MVIFGAGGDLTKRLLVPALYNLASTGLLPEHFELIGVSLRPARLLLDLHRVVVVAVVIVVVIDIDVLVVFLWLAMRLLLWYIHQRRRLGRACSIIEVDDLVALVKTIVGFGRWCLGRTPRSCRRP